MKIATFNVNSVRVRLENLLAWLAEDDIDIVALQETKAQDKDFPVESFRAAGYHAAYKGEKGKNGVAIISKMPPESISFDLAGIGAPGEARLIQADFPGFSLINTYVPQGQEVGTDYFAYKLRWLAGMRDYLAARFSPRDNVIWLGDLNVAPEARDVYDPKRLAGAVGFHPDEQAALAMVMAWGLLDVFRRHVPEGGVYTFWDYRLPKALERGLGWRIDHILATAPLAEKSVGAYVAKHLRATERPSDHAPLVAEFAL
jgi:exodeoxyribonuclease-3